MSKVSSGDSKNTLYCSFCGKSQHEVRKLIAGPTVFICFFLPEPRCQGAATLLGSKLHRAG